MEQGGEGFALALENSADPLQLAKNFYTLCAERAKLAEKEAVKKVATPHQQLLQLREAAAYASERDTWLLVWKLYADRLQRQAPQIKAGDARLRTEKQVWELMENSETALRELRIVVEWLECTASFELDENRASTTVDEAKWKRTLEVTLEDNGSLEFDPDGPYRTNEHLEEDDQEDEERLMQAVWRFIRAGKPKQAQQLCRDSGQYWRAASLGGEMVWHDSNLVLAPEHPIGNSTRPLWFEAASALASQDAINPYERATYGILCGHLYHVLPICLRWEDHLWARARAALVHARNEASDRARVLESRYRAQDFPSLHSIFEELLRADSPEVRKGSNQPHHIVQTLVALDRPGLILSLLTQWTLPAGPTLIAPPQLLRFAAHMGLFLHALGRTGNVMDGDPADLPSADGIIIAYIRHLISTQQKKQVALYTSKLQLERQVGTYAAFLRDIVDHKERQECLELARLHGLDVHLITQCVVRLATSEQKSGNLHKESSPGISQEDNERIAALEWLMFNPSQIAHALRHSNTLTRRFILEKKPIAARKVQTSLPSNAVALAKQFWSKVCFYLTNNAIMMLTYFV